MNKMNLTKKQKTILEKACNRSSPMVVRKQLLSAFGSGFDFFRDGIHNPRHSPPRRRLLEDIARTRTRRAREAHEARERGRAAAAEPASGTTPVQAEEITLVTADSASDLRRLLNDIIERLEEVEENLENVSEEKLNEIEERLITTQGTVSEMSTNIREKAELFSLHIRILRGTTVRLLKYINDLDQKMGGEGTFGEDDGPVVPS